MVTTTNRGPVSDYSRMAILGGELANVEDEILYVCKLLHLSILGESENFGGIFHPLTAIHWVLSLLSGDRT